MRADVEHDEVLRAIYEDPQDLQLRLVYADMLLMRGDLRGELIQLQLLHHHDLRQRNKAQGLLGGRWRWWVGDLAPILDKRVEFEAGFLSRCQYAANVTSDAIKACREDPAWSTVKTLGLGRRGGSVGLAQVDQPVMRSIEALRGVHDSRLARQLVSGGKTRLLKRVEVGWNHDLGEDLANCFALPQLEELELTWPYPLGRDRVRWLWKGELVRRLKRLVLSVDDPRSWFELAADWPFEIVLHSHWVQGWDFHIQGDEVVARQHGGGDPSPRLVRALTDTPFSTIRIETKHERRPSKKSLLRLATLDADLPSHWQ